MNQAPAGTWALLALFLGNPDAGFPKPLRASSPR
jgi:hypothetical protein